MRITELTEYQFPKEKTLCYSGNRIADVTTIDVMRPMGASTQFSRQKNTITSYSVYSQQTAIQVYSVNSAPDSRILFCSFRNQNGSQKNTITVNSVYSHSGIVPKERALNRLNVVRLVPWSQRFSFAVKRISSTALLLENLWHPGYKTSPAPTKFL